MPIAQCTNYVGRRLLVETAPGMREARGVFYIPHGKGFVNPGLFEISGRAVSESITYRGATKNTATLATTCEDLPQTDNAPLGPTYVYLGECTKHYGHFLVGAYARLWPLLKMETKGVILVTSLQTSIGNMIKLDYFQTILRALDLPIEGILDIQQPTRFDRIIVPSSTFEELNLIYKEFSTMSNIVGRLIVGSANIKSGTPRDIVYFSKEKLERGVIGIKNENELTSHLSELGVNILFPEQFTFEDQLKFWAQNPVAVAFSGSSLHTSAFFPARSTISIAHSSNMWVNQPLIDMANGNKSRHIYDSNGLHPLGRTGNFHNIYEIKKPKDLADSLVNYIKSEFPS